MKNFTIKHNVLIGIGIVAIVGAIMWFSSATTYVYTNDEYGFSLEIPSAIEKIEGNADAFEYGEVLQQFSTRDADGINVLLSVWTEDPAVFLKNIYLGLAEDEEHITHYEDATEYEVEGKVGDTFQIFVGHIDEKDITTIWTGWGRGMYIGMEFIDTPAEQASRFAKDIIASFE